MEGLENNQRELGNTYWGLAVCGLNTRGWETHISLSGNKQEG